MVGVCAQKRAEEEGLLGLSASSSLDHSRRGKKATDLPLISFLLFLFGKEENVETVVVDPH